MKSTRLIASFAAVALCGCAFSSIVPAAFAAESEIVTSSRSFPKTTAVKKNLYVESVGTLVEEDSDWGSIESLDVPQTKSQAEQEAEARQQTQAETRAAAAQAQAANRSQARSPLGSTSSTATVDAPTSSDGAALIAYASQFVGAPYVYGGTTPAGWDCSGFTQYVFAQFGKSIGRSTSAQINAGTRVSTPQPGDLMISTDVSHAGIYVGNGLMIHAISSKYGTRITPIAGWGPTNSYYYLRIL